MRWHKVENPQESLLGFKCLSTDINKVIGKMQREEVQSLPDIVPHDEVKIPCLGKGRVEGDVEK